MKNLIYIFLIGLLAGCRDDKNALIFHNDEINGVAYLKDRFFDSDTKIAGEVTVFLHDGDDTKNYLLKTEAGKDGKFRFVFQPRSNENIRIVSEFRDTASILFTAKTNASGFKDSLILQPSYPKGTIKVKTKDTGDSLFSGMDVFVFTNLAQAEAAKKGPAKGAIRSLKSNDRGTAFFYNLEIGDYFIVGKKDSVTITDIKTVVVSAQPENGVYKYKSNLKTTPGTEITEKAPLSISLSQVIHPILYTVTVTSDAGQALSGVDVYLFTSLAQANSVEIEAANFVAKAKTGLNGVAEIRNVPEGSYYVAASGKFADQGVMKIKFKVGTTPIKISAKAPSPIPNFPLSISI